MADAPTWVKTGVAAALGATAIRFAVNVLATLKLFARLGENAWGPLVLVHLAGHVAAAAVLSWAERRRGVGRSAISIQYAAAVVEATILMCLLFVLAPGRPEAEIFGICVGLAVSAICAWWLGKAWQALMAVALPALFLPCMMVSARVVVWFPWNSGELPTVDFYSTATLELAVFASATCHLLAISLWLILFRARVVKRFQLEGVAKLALVQNSRVRAVLIQGELRDHPGMDPRQAEERVVEMASRYLHDLAGAP